MGSMIEHFMGYSLALSSYVVVSSLQHGENYSLFLQFSPWRNPRLRHFAGYSSGTSRKKASTVSYGTAQKIIEKVNASGNKTCRFSSIPGMLEEKRRTANNSLRGVSVIAGWETGKQGEGKGRRFFPLRDVILRSRIYL